jgi:hypothetical protein
MPKQISFIRSQRNDAKVIRNIKKDRDTRSGTKYDIKDRYRYQKHKQVLFDLNISLMGKMEEIRVLPLNYANDEIGSFFYDDLELLNSTESSGQFKFFYLTIVDKSQSLPIILLNKEFLLEQILANINTVFFHQSCTKLLISLIRDCGEELFDLTLSDIVPQVAQAINVADPKSIERAFRIFACILKFLLKPILLNVEQFVKVFLSHMLKIRNSHCRRFTSECVIYLVNKTRNKQELNTTIRVLFSMDLDFLGIDSSSKYTVSHKEDFDASLLYLLMKGEKGYLSQRAVDLIDFVSEMLCKDDIEGNFFKKAFNLLVENEYKYFKTRHSEDTLGFLENTSLEDYLEKLTDKCLHSTFGRQNLILVLVEILLLGRGERLTPRLVQLSEKLMKDTGAEVLEENLIFLAKFICVKNTVHGYLKTLLTMEVQDDQLLLFLSNLFRRTSFKRTKVQVRFRKDAKEDETIEIPSLSKGVTEYLTVFFMNSLQHLWTSKRLFVGEQNSINLFFISQLFEHNLQDAKLKLDSEMYNGIVSFLAQPDKIFVREDTQQPMTLKCLGLLRLVKLSSNLDQDKAIFAQFKNAIVQTGRYIRTGVAKEIKKRFDTAKLYDAEYLRSIQIKDNDCELKDLRDLMIVVRCEYLTILLGLSGVNAHLQFIYDELKSLLLSVEMNHSSVIRTLLHYKKACLEQSKAKKTGLGHVQSQGGQWVFSLDESEVRQRLKLYLRCNIPSARICALKLLATPGEPLYRELVELDRIDINLYKERELFITTDAIATNLFYNKYNEEEVETLFNFMIGFASNRISTVLKPIGMALAIIMFRSPKQDFFEDFIKEIAIRNHFDSKADFSYQPWILEDTEGLEYRQIYSSLYVPAKDPVDPHMHYLRLLDTLPDIMAFIGIRNTVEAGEVNKKMSEDKSAKRISQMHNELDDEGEDELAGTQEEDRPFFTCLDAQAKQMKMYQIEVLYKLFEHFIGNELKTDVIPSLGKLFPSEEELATEQLTTEQIFNKMKANLSKDSESKANAGIKKSKIERLKRLLKGLKSSAVLKNFETGGRLDSYLLEVIKFPGEEVQALALGALLKIKGSNRIIAQYSPILTNLTGKDSFKENLMRLIEKVRLLSEIERKELLPIINSILYRRLIDKAGTDNHKKFESNRDFIFDIASFYSPAEVANLIDTLLCSHGLLNGLGQKQDLERTLTTMPVSRLLGLVSLCENMFKRIGEQIRPHIPGLMDIFLSCVVFSVKITEHCKEERKAIEEVIALLKDRKAKAMAEERFGEKLVADEQQEGEEEQEGKEEAVDDGLFQNEDDEDIIEDLTPDQRLTVKISKYLKDLKQGSLKRIIQVQSNFVEDNYLSLNHKLLHVLRPSIDRWQSKPLLKNPLLFKLLGVWSESEIFKPYFFETQFPFLSLVSTLRNKEASVLVYVEVLEMIQKCVEYSVSESNERELGLPAICSKYLGSSTTHRVQPAMDKHSDDMMISALGERLIQQSIDIIVTSLGELSANFAGKKLAKVKRTDFRFLQNRISRFTLFITDYCTHGDITLKFYEIVKRSWDVTMINRKTNKPPSRINTAQELTFHNKEQELAMSMMKTLSNFCDKVPKVEELFSTILIPLISQLEELKLRSVLSDCLEKLASNKSFAVLKIDTAFVLKLAELHKLLRNLHKSALDANKIVDFLMEVQGSLESLSPNESKLLISECLYWMSTEELSVREKSLDLVKRYIAGLDLNRDHEFYRTTVIGTATYFLGSPFPVESTLKSFSLLLRAHCCKLSEAMIDQGTPPFPYADLGPLMNENKEKDFFDLVFNIKIGNRGQAIRVLKKLIVKKKATFSQPTIKAFLVKIFDFYLYEFWREANSSQNAYSVSRLDSIRGMLLIIYDVYGRLVGMLPFPAFIKFLKDKIFSMNGKAEKHTDTSVKIICACLQNLDPSLPNVLKKLQEEQETISKTEIQKSVINSFLKAYENQKLVTSARIGFDYQTENAKDSQLVEAAEPTLEPIEQEVENDESESDEEMKIETTEVTEAQLRTLKFQILYPLKRHLCKKDEKEPSKFSINQEVALSILQLIKIFPLNLFNSELIGTINKVCSVLADRDDNKRKSARNTLAQMLKELGPYFLGFFVKELAFHLKRGFEMHVRNYTIHKLIETLIKPVQGEPIKTGSIDYSIRTIAPLLMDEIMGDLEAEKEVEEIKHKIIEYKKNKGVDSFKLLASKIDFTSEAMRTIVKYIQDFFNKGKSSNKVTSVQADPQQEPGLGPLPHQRPHAQPDPHHRVHHHVRQGHEPEGHEGPRQRQRRGRHRHQASEGLQQEGHEEVQARGEVQDPGGRRPRHVYL